MLAAAAVALGAFGAHGLKSRLSAEMLAVWNTAVQYHFWHALGVLLIAGWLTFAASVIFARTPG